MTKDLPDEVPGLPDTLPDSPGELFEWIADLLFKRYVGGAHSPIRVVVVLGAGSSVWSGLQTWDTNFKKQLVDEACRLFKIEDNFVRECWRKLSHVIGLEPDDVETRRSKLVQDASIEDIASVALESAIVSDVVYKLLTEKFTPTGSDPAKGTQPPQLAYELIAHLLKHSFVDHLITFNFDELLDEAIRNELGRHDFQYVASDQDIISSHAPPALPHLIKLHGTLGRPGTLRFTRDATGSLPAATIRLLDQVIFGENNGTTLRHTFVVSLGYGWRDSDVRHWLNARKSRLAGLVVVSKDWDCEPLRQRFPATEWPQVRILDIDALCQGSKDPVTVDLLLWALSRDLEARLANAEPPIPFMPASRHLLLSHLFRPKPLQPGVRFNDHDPLRRFVVEFVLHLAKCKGMVNLSTLSSNDRIGRYYGLVKREYAGIAQAAETDLLELVTSIEFVKNPRGSRPPLELSVRLSQYPDVKETYFAVAKSPHELATSLLDRNDFAILSVWVPNYSKKLGRITTGDKAVGGKEFIEEQIATIFGGPEIEVALRESDRESWALRSAAPLSTYRDLTSRTHEILESDWSDLLVVAESGAWMTSPSNRQRIMTGAHRRIFLLNAATVDPAQAQSASESDEPVEWPLGNYIDHDLERVWDEYRSHGIQVRAIALPWWQHNRHMTLAFRTVADALECTGGVYFRRRHKKSRIQPLALSQSDHEDVGEVMLTFMAYMRRAFEERGRRGMPITDNESAMLTGCVRLATAVTRKAPPTVRERLNKVLGQFAGLP